MGILPLPRAVDLPARRAIAYEVDVQGLTVQIAACLALLPVAARVAGLLLVAPVFGHQAVPVRLRLLMAAVIALAAMGMVAPPPAPTTVFQLAATCATELAAGAAIGFAAGLIFTGVELAAVHVSAQMGISLGEVSGGVAEEGGGPVVAAYRIMALAIFLVIGGHRDLLSALMGTLEVAPVGALALKPAILSAVVALLGAAFLLALKVAAPVLVALLLAAVAMGVLQRTLPQCHILSTGLPVRAMLGLLMMALGVAVLAWAVESAWALTGRTLSDLVRTMV